jgi:hypothetical protein
MKTGFLGEARRALVCGGHLVFSLFVLLACSACLLEAPPPVWVESPGVSLGERDEDPPPSYEQRILPFMPHAFAGCCEAPVVRDGGEVCPPSLESVAQMSTASALTPDSRTTYREKIARAGAWCLSACLSLLD